MIKFEGMDARLPKINAFLQSKGIADLEEARQICLDNGVDVEKMPLLVPSGGGVRYDLTRVEQEDTWKKIKGTSGYEARWSYPGYRISMPWLQFTSGDRSLYIVSYDPDFRWKIFRIQYFPDERRAAFRVENKLTCFPGETWNGAPVKIAWNEGSWKEGAREYRAAGADRAYFISGRKTDTYGARARTVSGVS